MTFKKTYTENPFIDEIIYHTKIMTFYTVLKDQEEADANETVESAQESIMYIAAMRDKESFEMFKYTREDLIAAGITETHTKEFPNGQVNYCLENIRNIPTSLRSTVLAIAKKRVIETYEEKNNYYRMLNGKPNVGEEGLMIVSNKLNDPNLSIDLSRPIHEMTDSEITVLDELGVVDDLIEQYPDKKYLRHLGGKKIDIVTARTASKFDILYVPAIDFADLRQRFIDNIEQMRYYTIRCLYSEAFKLGSEEFYDKFMMLFIVLQSAISLLSETQVAIANRDVYDVRCIQYIFSSYGIPYYQEIPVKYQINMMKNLNKLIKYKATGMNMIDICSLFGFPDIQVFKYYILKDRNIDPESGEFIYSYDADGNENLDAEYDLKFIRVPLEDNLDSYIKDSNNYFSYQQITGGDRYWDENGTLTDEVKAEILKKEFNIMRSKYFSIDTTCEMTEIAFELPYFFNMLYDDVHLEEKLTMSVPYIANNTSFKFNDLFVMIFALGYLYNGLEDTIMDTNGKVLSIMGFNFKENMNDIANHLLDKGYTLADLGIEDFQIPNASIMTYNQLLEIFTTNKRIHDHVTEQIMNADDKHIFDIYTDIYKSLMIMDFTNHYFKIGEREDGTPIIAPTYTKWMETRDTILYNILVDIANIQPKEIKNPNGPGMIRDYSERRREIDKYLQAIVETMQQFIDSDKYSFVYSNIPGETAEYIQRYVIKVISFFKSYKVDLVGMNTIYTIDDKFNNFMRAIDQIHHMDVTYHKTESMTPQEIQSFLARTKYTEKITTLDQAYIQAHRKAITLLEDLLQPITKENISIIGKPTYKEGMYVKEVFTYASRIVD